MADARIGTGTTITLGTTDYAVQRMSVAASGISVPVIDTTHLGTTSARTKIMGDLIDFGSLEIEANGDPDELDTLKTTCGLAQTVTLTFPILAPETVGATMAGSAAISAASFTVPLEDKFTATFTLTWLGDVTFTDAT